jgi:hypothetical protein
MSVKGNQLEVPFLQAEKDKLTGIETNAQANPAIADQAEAEAGLDNAKYMTSLRVSQAIAAQVGVGAGEANTVSNEGAGQGLFIQKAGVNFEFKTLIAGTGVTFGVGADTITINASAGGLTNTDDLTEGSTNLYYTEARVSANSDVAANTAKVSASGSISTHSDVTISAPSNGQALIYSGGQWVNTTLGGGGDLLSSNNLSDVANAATSLSNLGGLAASNIVPQAEAEAGTATTARVWTAERVKQAIDALGGGGGGSSPTVVISLGAGATIADKIANAPVGGIPAGYTLVDGTHGSVDAQLSGDAADLIIIHNEGKVAVGGSVSSLDTLFGGWLNRPYAAGDYNTLAGTGESVISFDLVSI